MRYTMFMLLYTHIIIALISIIISSWLAFAPSKRKLRASGGLVGLTLLTGTELVWSTHQPLVASCLTGLLYLGVVSIGLVVGARRLATAKQSR